MLKRKLISYHYLVIIFFLSFYFADLRTSTAIPSDTTRTQVAPGFFLTQINDFSTPLRITALEVNIARPGVSIRTALANNSMSNGFETTYDMANRYDQDDYKVVGAINGDYFGMRDPGNRYTFLRNMNIKDGEYVINGKRDFRSQFGVDNDGVPFFDMLDFFGEIILEEDVIIPISNVNQRRLNEGVVLYNHFFGNSSLTDENGVEILIYNEGKKAINEFVTFTVVSIEENIGNMTIPDNNHDVLSAAGNIANEIIEKVKVGDRIKLRMSFQPKKVEGRLYVGGLDNTIHGYNTARRSDELIIYDRKRGTGTRTNDRGIEVLVKPLDQVNFNGETELLVVEKESEVGNMYIPQDHVVLSAHGSSRIFLHFSVDAGDTLLLDLKSKPNIQNAKQLVGGGPRLISDGVFPEDWEGLEEFGHATEEHPRSAIGLSRDSTRLYLVVVDGRQPSSRGVTLEELANIMYDFGAWNAINLDGGGSSTLIVDDEWVHQPTHTGEMRPVGNSILIISEPHDEKVFGGIRIIPENKEVVVGNEFTLTAIGEDLWGDEVEINLNEIYWELLDHKVSQKNDSFIAREIGESKIAAHYKHSSEIYSDTAKIKIKQEISSDIDSKDHPKEFDLHQNYPNPFNTITNIRYTVPEESHVNISVYDVLGRKIETLTDQWHQTGYYSIGYDAKNMSTGIYLYELTTSSFIDRKKMMLIK